MEDLILSLQARLLAAVAEPVAGTNGIPAINAIKEVDVNQLMEKGQALGIKLIAALAVFIIGRIVARFLSNTVKRLMNSRKVEPTLVSFVTSFTFVALMTFVILAAIGQLGVQTTSFIAVIGAAGLAVGLALQGSLANFASGVLLIIFRPFKVGDYIEGGGTAGTVEEIQIFTTTLKSPDNRKIIVPNAGMTSGNITNFSAKETRRVDLVVGISYGDDIDKARNLILEVLKAEKRVLEDPPVTVAVSELGDSSVNFVVRPWVLSGDYWPVKFAITEAIKKKLDAGGVTIPFPQRDVHVYQHTNE